MGDVLAAVVFRSAILCWVFLSLVGCKDNGYPPGCHWDCGGYAECRDGEVIDWEHVPVPCDEWSGQCPHCTYTCEKGCNTNPDYVECVDGVCYGYGHPYGYGCGEGYMCEEDRPKVPGDPCTEENDCEPPDYYLDDNGHSIRYELTCDTDAGECVEVPGP